MKRVISTATMRCSDAETIRHGISGRELMWRAGQAIYNSHSWQGRVAIVCGSGNNAGDGYVLALLLHRDAIPCTLIRLSDKLSEDGGYYYAKCAEAGVDEQYFSAETAFDAYDVIVDCILGTGFSGTVSGAYAEAIKRINEAKKFVISVDINSGLSGDSGQGDCAIRSDLTLSIGYYQYGHFLGRAKDLMRQKRNLEIGIDLYGESAGVVEACDLAAILKPRLQSSHKGDYGYVTLLGGCREYAGAVKLANLSCAALRCGCGVATLAVPNAIADSVSPHLLESTLAPLPDEDGHAILDTSAIDRILSRRAAIAIGMGWGRSPHNSEILQYVLKNYARSVVIDADGLNTLAEMDREILRQTDCRVLLTPHPLEFSRLCGHSVAQILENPVAIAQQYAREMDVCLLLKGPCTVVTDGEETLLVDRGCAGMATAGSGDVLSGILAGLLGYSELTPLTAACGAYIAGLAGELAAAEQGEISMLASDTVHQISRAIGAIQKEIKQ